MQLHYLKNITWVLPKRRISWEGTVCRDSPSGPTSRLLLLWKCPWKWAGHQSNCLILMIKSSGIKYDMIIYLRGVPGWCLNWMKSGREVMSGQLSSLGVPSAWEEVSRQATTPHINPKRDLEDLRQLIEIGVAGQERNAEQQLCQDATHCPDIHPNLGWDH